MNSRIIPKDRIGYYFDEEVGIYTFKKGHPMRPLRIKITDELIRSYKMDELMVNYDSMALEIDDDIFYNFHSEEYIDLLKNIDDSNIGMYQDQFQRFGFSADCPNPTNSKFYDFCKLYTTGSILGALELNNKNKDIFINWSGGLHHAKRQEASGFCYVNDCVLAILEMLKVHSRVLYLDIDVHHGDGVEEAFLTTDRVMTCSFHKFKDFFPGTGHYLDVGFENGKYHAVNFPLNEGIDDMTYETIFVPVMEKIIQTFKPSAILMQCGSDSLSGDKLGCFNLSVRGHGKCVEFIKSKNIPLLLVGGGGYTLRNIPRCWTYETSIALGYDLPNEIPENQYSDYFYPEGTIHTPISNMDNLNTENELHMITNKIIENLNRLQLYTNEMNVEDSNPKNTKQDTYNEKKKNNIEKQEELSEKHRSSVNNQLKRNIYFFIVDLTEKKNLRPRLWLLFQLKTNCFKILHFFTVYYYSIQFFFLQIQKIIIFLTKILNFLISFIYIYFLFLQFQNSYVFYIKLYFSFKSSYFIKNITTTKSFYIIITLTGQYSVEKRVWH